MAPHTAADLGAPARLQLDSGLTVVVKEHPGSEVVAIQAWVGVGSADEPEELAGISHVFEHMLFKGTARRGVGAIAREVEAAGGEINAWTSFDQTVYHLVMASRYFDAGLDILTDALRNSAFDPVELGRELQVVLEEVKQGEDSPSRVATQSLFRAAYRRHPYRRPVIGHARVVEGLRRRDLVTVFRRFYVPSNITLIVVGDVEAAAVHRRVERAWRGARTGPRPAIRRLVEPPQRRTRVAHNGGEVSEVHLVGGFHIPSMRHADTPALDLAAIVLGQGESSRLQVDLKRRQQLVTEAWAYSFTPREPGLLVVGANFPPDRLDQGPEALLRATFRLAHEEVEEAELEKARAILESDAVYQKETVQGMARKLGYVETVAGSPTFEDEYLAAARRITPASLREVMARYLRPDNATLSLMLPARAAELQSASGRRALDRAMVETVERASRPPKRRAIARAGARPDAPVAAHTRRGEVVRQELPSGMRVLVLRDPSVPLVAMRAAWAGGLREETEADNGVNNLIAALLTRGTATRSGDQIAHEMETLAGSIGGISGRNSLGLRAEVMARHLDHGLEVLAECLTAPAFADDELAREKRQVLEEIRTQEDNVSAVAFRMFGRALWPSHPYRMDMLGTPASLEGLTAERVGAWYREHYHPGRLALAVVGDVEPAEVIERLARLFPGRAPAAPAARRGGKASSPHKVGRAPGPIRVSQALPKQQAHLVYGFPGTTLGHPDRFALELLSTLLSGQGGRLFVDLREKRGLAYRVSAFTLEGLDPGYFAVYVSCSPDKVALAEERIHAELRRIATHLVPAAELERARRYLAGSHAIALQRRSALAATLAFNECYGLGWDQYQRYVASMLAVTREQLLEAAARYLDPDRSVTALVSPDPLAAAPPAARSPRVMDSAARAPGASRKR